MDATPIPMIGGDICKQKVPPGLMQGDRQILTHANREFLWKIFLQIANTWGNVKYDSTNLKSSWLDLIASKSNVAPSYTAEYVNAVYVVQELIDMYGEADAFHKLFLANGIPAGPPATRLAHAKTYVINEFIIMQVMASGFKHFGGVNYHGYVKGSRYNRLQIVREYVTHQVTGKTTTESL